MHEWELWHYLKCNKDRVWWSVWCGIFDDSFDCIHVAPPYPVANMSTFSIDLQGSCCIFCCLSAFTYPFTLCLCVAQWAWKLPYLTTSSNVPPAVPLKPSKHDALSPNPEKWTADFSVFIIVVEDIVGHCAAEQKICLGPPEKSSIVPIHHHRHISAPWMPGVTHK